MAAENGNRLRTLPRAMRVALWHHFQLVTGQELMCYCQRDGRFYLHRPLYDNPAIYSLAKRSISCNLIIGVVESALIKKLSLTHTHTHTTVLLLVWNMSGSTWVSRYQKGKTKKVKTNLDLLEQEIVSLTVTLNLLLILYPSPNNKTLTLTLILTLTLLILTLWNLTNPETVFLTKRWRHSWSAVVCTATKALVSQCIATAAVSVVTFFSETLS